MRNRYRSIVVVAGCVLLPATAVHSGFWTTWNLAVSPSPGGYVDLSAILTPLTCTSDCDEAAWTVGFGPPPTDTFFYGGVEYDSIYVTTNAYAIPMNVGDPVSISAFNQYLPDATPPNNVIAPFWTDLDLKGTGAGDPGGGQVYAGTGNFLGGTTVYSVIEWHEVEVKFNPGVTFTLQLWIELGTDNVWIVYDNLGAIDTVFMTIGIEDAPGTSGYTYHFQGNGEPPTKGVDLKVVYDPDNIFATDLESGNLGGWTAVVGQ
jgi:minor extracellular serine protease Vpr